MDGDDGLLGRDGQDHDEEAEEAVAEAHDAAGGLREAEVEGWNEKRSARRYIFRTIKAGRFLWRNI